MLVDKGIDIEIKNNFGKTSAEEAYDKNHMEISEYLVEKEVAILKNIEIFDDLKDIDYNIENEDDINNNNENNENYNEEVFDFDLNINGNDIN